MAAAGRTADWPSYECDLADLAALESSIARIEAEFGVIRVLVNNAALYQPCDFDKLTPAQWDMVFAINTRAPVFASQSIIRRLRQAEAGGAIVNVASVSGQVGSAAVDYAASKAALIAITKSLGKLGAACGIRVNAVAPGGIVSAMSARLPERTRSQLLERTPLGRLAEPLEIAEVVGFLADEESSYMTGTTIDVNGGAY